MFIGSALATLSGGLDSAISLAESKSNYNVKMILFINYAQRAYESELKAVKSISGYYDIPLKIINLDWLAEITDTALVNKNKIIPEYTVESLNNDISVLNESAKAVWVPNRNGVILNVAAAFAESLKCQHVIFGANSEEAVTFSDNSIEYVNKQNDAFEYSTSNHVKVISPLSAFNKTEIVALALKKDFPLDLIWSCYESGEKHCSHCESCNRLKRALENNGLQDVWRKIS